MDVSTTTVLHPPESERGSNPMRTRYQHGSLQLDANDDERLHSGSQRTETGSPFQRCKNDAGLEKTHDVNQLDIYGHGTCGNFRKISWLMVGAIGFEPMTSTV
jgi:hypothetical protein